MYIAFLNPQSNFDLEDSYWMDNSPFTEILPGITLEIFGIDSRMEETGKKQIVLLTKQLQQNCKTLVM